MGVTYGTGALIAADRGERRMWARHRALLLRREVPTVPAPVVAQSWRGSNRQVLLARILSGCDVEALDGTQARSVGALAARAATSDIVDACVVTAAVVRCGFRHCSRRQAEPPGQASGWGRMDGAVVAMLA
jgi:hypothetical protein